MNASIESFGEIKMTLALVAAGYLSAEEAFPLLLGKVEVTQDQDSMQCRVHPAIKDARNMDDVHRLAAEFHLRETLRRLAAGAEKVQETLKSVTIL